LHSKKVSSNLEQAKKNLEPVKKLNEHIFHELIQKYGDLAEQSVRQKEILDRLIGYSLTNESDHLNLEEKLRALEARMKRLENQN